MSKDKNILLAPNGKPSNLTHELYYLVRTPEFKSWFGDFEKSPETSSKVVDENGEPKVVFNGAVKNFTIFDREKIGYIQFKNTKIPYTGGFFFTDKYNVAKSYVYRADQNLTDKINRLISGKVRSCFLNIKNPYTVSMGNKWDCIYTNSDTKECFSTDDVSRSVYTLMDNDGVIFNKVIDTGNKEISSEESNIYVAFESNQIKLANGSNTKFDKNNPDIRFEYGGEIKKHKETYGKWKSLVNMSKGELEKFYNSQEGKDAGLTINEAKEKGINSGRESARWIMKMKDTPVSEWTPVMWKWAKKQISFISRMSGIKGELYDDKGNKTRKHTSLLIWGHNPEKMEKGGTLVHSEKEIQVCDKLYKEHHDTWDKIDAVEKGVNIGNTKKYSYEIALMWEEHMQHHFADEEENFFPYVKEDDKKAVEYLLLEHKAIIDLIQQIKQHNKIEDILKFCAMIKNHIKKEEVLMNDVCPDAYAEGGSIDNLFYKQAVKEVISLPAYSDLSQKEGEFLYDTFKNYESLYEDEDEDEFEYRANVEKNELEGDKLKDYRDFLEELENKKYIINFYDSDNTINPSQITINFVNSVRGRIETLSNYKSSNSDLFNESITIEEPTEPESKLKEISNWHSSINFDETKANYTRSTGEQKANYVVADYFGVEPVTLSRFNDYDDKTGSYPLDYKKEFSTVEEAIEYANEDLNKHLLVKRKEALAKKDEYIKEIKSYVLLSKDSKKYNNNLRSLYAEYFNEVVCYNPELWMELQELFIDANAELRKDVFLAPFTTTYDRFELQSILDFYQNLNMSGKHDFWSLIPEKFVSNSPVNKKQLTTLDPFDSVFMSIFGLFTSDDKNRPNIQGVNFDDFGVTATDGSKLIHIPYSEKYKSKLRGIYNLKDNKELKSINAIKKPHQYKGLKYPNYNAVIPSMGSETIIYSFTMDELNKLINELKTLSKANCNRIDSRLIFVTYLKDLGYKYVDMSMFIDDLYAASMMGSRKIEICFPSINSMFISDDVISFANGRKSKRIASRQTIRENWGILQQAIKSIETQEFCYYDFDKKQFVNPNLNEETVVKIDTSEVDALNERLELVKEMLAEDNSNESLKDRVELLQEMIEEKSTKLLYGGKILYSDKIDDSKYSVNITMDEIYEIWEKDTFISLGRLINHDKLFEKNPEFKKITVKFVDIADDEIYAFAETNFRPDNIEYCDIIIGLHFTYYKKNKHEKYDINNTDRPECSKEAVILHEIQHVLQFKNRGEVGFGYDKVHENILKTIIDGAKYESKEGVELDAQGLKDLAFFLYKEQPTEQEAMLFVAIWLYSKGLEYGNKMFFESSLLNELNSLKQSDSTKNFYERGGKYNPYAVCTTSIGKKSGTQKRSKWNKKQMKKYEDCVLSFEEGGSLVEDTYLGFYDRDTKELKATVFIDKQNIGSKTHIRLIDNATDKNMFAKRIDKEVHENFSPEIETKKTQNTGLSKDKVKAIVKNEGIVYAVSDYLSGSEISLYEKTLRDNWIEANKEIYHLDKLIESLPKVHVLKEIQDENGFHFIIEAYVTEISFDDDKSNPHSQAVIESLEKIKVTLRKITDELGLNVMGSENGEEFGKGGKLGGCGCGH
jgi:hypothetical protein